MSFDLDAEQRAAQQRLSKKLDQSVRKARARIYAYTPTEHAEASAGIRVSEVRARWNELIAAVTVIGKAGAADAIAETWKRP